MTSPQPSQPTQPTQAKQPLLSVRGLKQHFPIRRGFFRRTVGAVRAVDGLTFDLYPGETLGLVGESGCGKSTTGRALLHLPPPTEGTVTFEGQDLGALSPSGLRAARRQMQMIFQDPYSALNPRHTVGRLIAEPLEVHQWGDAAGREDRVAALLERVGLSPHHAARYPHQFSGGQRQRIGIARALATHPRLLIADEPIAALDVSIQAQVVNLLSDLKAELGLTYLFIAHDLAMVRFLSDRVAVMYLGRIVELGPSADVFAHPRHPYTWALRSAIPSPDPSAQQARVVLPGEVPSPADPPEGCHFHPRCPFATDRCRTEDPPLRNLGTDATPHQVACHHAESLDLSSPSPSTPNP